MPRLIDKDKEFFAIYYAYLYYYRCRSSRRLNLIGYKK